MHLFIQNIKESLSPNNIWVGCIFVTLLCMFSEDISKFDTESTSFKIEVNEDFEKEKETEKSEVDKDFHENNSHRHFLIATQQLFSEFESKLGLLFREVLSPPPDFKL